MPHLLYPTNYNVILLQPLLQLLSEIFTEVGKHFNPTHTNM